MKSLFFSLVAGSLSVLATSAFAADAPRGSLLELHSCELYAGGCTVSAEATQGGRYMLRVWDFAGGEFAGTDFKDLKLAVLQSSRDNLAAKDSESGDAVVYLPKTATQTQRDALLAWVKSSQKDFHPNTLHVRVEPLAIQKTASTYSFSAGNYISVETKPLTACDNRSCGEELWYEPRAATSVFTVAVNRSSNVAEPFLKLDWKDSAQRSVFLGRFGDSSTGREIFVTMNEFCGATGIF
ncbi:MAG TPA: DUF1326 domain-containing protein [Verrucomicrobiae bacterium]